MKTFAAALLAGGMVLVLVLPFLPGYLMERRRKRANDQHDAPQGCSEETQVLVFGRLQGPASDGRTRAFPTVSTVTPAIVIIEPQRPNAWASEPTDALSVIEEYDTEWKPVASGPVAEAEVAFYADPLGSWCPPPESALVDLDFLPEAAGTFDLLVERGWLTGEGADIDVEWEAWNLYESERVNA